MPAAVTEAPHRQRETLGSASRTGCAHCGLPAAPRSRHEAGPLFCCDGCATAFSVLQEAGLTQYYELRERRPVAVRLNGRRYDEFAHPAFESQYVQTQPDGARHVELFIEGVHCAACVWLVERLPLLLPGVLRAELQVSRSLATVEWDPARTDLPAIARALSTLGYPPHPFRGVKREAIRRAADRAALLRIGVAGAIAVNVMLAALAMYSGWLHDGMERSLERYFRWISLVLSLATLAGPGRVFFAGAWAAVRARTLHLDLPIALALGAAFARGSINTIVDRGPVYFDAVALLVFLLLIGRYLQQRGQRLTADASELLASLTPNAALVRQPDDSTRELPLSALLPGMIVVVRPGDTVPADGVVLEGDSSIDSALLTGESRPQRAMAGTPVFAGTINVAGTLIVRVDRAGEATRVAEILHRVEESANRRAPIVILANRMAGYFVAIVLLLALVTLGIWWSHDPAGAVDHAIALLIVTCPCALAMATPLAVTVAVGRAARRGILVRGGDVIEALATPGTLLLDKTGTLTHGKLTLIQWEGPEWVKPFVLALERDARHPVAAAFQAAWPDMTAPNAVDVCHVPGAGVVGSVAGRAVLVGSPAFAASRGVEGVRSPADAGTPVVVAIDGVATAFAGFADTLRGDSAASVQRLRAEGWCVRILSGDDRAVVERVARTVGVARDDAIGGASPEAKLHEVERLRIAAREPVVMVGDGVNDAAAIAAASAGIAVHGGAEASLASADVYLGRPGLTPLLELTEGARRTMRIIRRNIAFSLTYNALGVFLAMAGLINPLIAAILMPVSSITVLLASWYGRSFERAPAGARQ